MIFASYELYGLAAHEIDRWNEHPNSIGTPTSDISASRWFVIEDESMAWRNAAPTPKTCRDVRGGNVGRVMTPSKVSLTALAESVRSGGRTFVEIHQRAIESRTAELDAYRHLNDEQVLAKANEADTQLAAGNDLGPLMGLPVSVKDLYGVPGFPTHAGSPRALPDEFTQPGPVVSALLALGAVVTGKTHTVEFAFGGIGTNPHLPTPKNPWDAERHRVPGGSSSGAGVSLCEGSAVLALGTDTAGSVRIPAAWTGKVGLKTTSQRWSTSGIVPLSTTLDTPGILANTVEDAVVAFSAIDPEGASSRADKADTLALGRCDRLFWDDLSDGVGEAVEQAIGELTAAGSSIRSLDLPEVEPTYELFCKGGPVGIELQRFLSSKLPEWFDTLDPNVRARLGDAATLPESEYANRLDAMAKWAAATDERFFGVDVVVAPTVANTPPRIEDVSTPELYGPQNLLALRNTSMANYLGLCALTLPVGLDAVGMPVGLMLMARGGHDERLLAVARKVEGVLGSATERLGTPPRISST